MLCTSADELYALLSQSFLGNIPSVSLDLIRRISEKENGKEKLEEMRRISISRIKERNLDADADLFRILDEHIPTCEELDVPDELCEFLEHSILLCTFIEIHFHERDMLATYYKRCMSGGKEDHTRFYQEILYLMLMRLDATFEEYIMLFVGNADTSPSNLVTKLEHHYPTDEPCRQLNGIYSQIVNEFRSDVPTFLKHTMHDIFHHLSIVIVLIPYMVRRNYTIIHSFIPLYNRIKLILPNVDPHTSIMGMYIYIRFMTATHIKLIYDDLMDPLKLKKKNIDENIQ